MNVIKNLSIYIRNWRIRYDVLLIGYLGPLDRFSHVNVIKNLTIHIRNWKIKLR